MTESLPLEPLKRVTLREIRLPLRDPFRISSGLVTTRRIFLLELEDGAGTTACSECVAMAQPIYSPETIDTAWFALEHWIVPKVLGRPFENPSKLHRFLDTQIRGHRMAKAALEMGSWALAATARGTSLAKLLGGTLERIPTGISLGIQETPEALITRVRAAMAEGYRKVKIKIGPGKDVHYLAEVRQALGDEPELMADANSAYTLDDIDHLAQLDAFRLMMIEQPLDWEDIRRHAELQRRIETPICLDESITDAERARDMIALGAGRIINLKPGRVGGFTNSLAIHDLCVEHGLGLWCGGMLESGIGRAYNVALASLAGFTLPGDVSPSARYWKRDIVTPEWTMDGEGYVTVPRDVPGLGVEVDVDWVQELTVREVVLEP